MVTVLYFAQARELAGCASEAVADAPGAADEAELRAWLASRHPSLADLLPRCRIAVDRELLQAATPLREGSEVAVLPPVSGG